MNRLYVELLKDNPEWGTTARRHDMNHFMARLIFCFFAERTDIFQGIGLFNQRIVSVLQRLHHAADGLYDQAGVAAVKCFQEHG
jgi:hypothetical protein